MNYRPEKFYYNFILNKQVDSDGVAINNTSLYPQIAQGDYLVQNYQLVDADGTTIYTGLSAGTTVKLFADTDYKNMMLEIPLGNNSWINSNGNEWEKSSSYTPIKLYFDGTLGTEGTAGALAVSEWSYADDTITVRLPDDSDPATHDDDFLTVEFDVEYTYTPPYIEVQNDGFNVDGSWWDEDIEAFRNPAIGNGEISFTVNANTVPYFMRIGAQKAVDCNAQMHFYTAGTRTKIKEFKLKCKNTINGSTLTQLDLIGLDVYTKSEVASLINNKPELPFPIAPGELITIAADGTIVNTGWTLMGDALMGPIATGGFATLEFKEFNGIVTLNIEKV